MKWKWNWLKLKMKVFLELASIEVNFHQFIFHLHTWLLRCLICQKINKLNQTELSICLYTNPLETIKISVKPQREENQSKAGPIDVVILFVLWCWILLWPQVIDFSVIVFSRRLLCRMCITESSLALDTPQNKSQSRLLFRAYEKQTNNVDADLRLDWSQTSVRGCRFTYTTKSFVPIPPHITEERTSRLDNINCRQISKSSCNF